MTLNIKLISNIGYKFSIKHKIESDNIFKKTEFMIL